MEEGRQAKSRTGIFLKALIAILAIIGAYTMSVEMDHKQTISQNNCEVLNKALIGGTYHVKTSCGSYEAVARVHDYLSVGYEYDLKVTKGNWATRPRIARASSCPERTSNTTLYMACIYAADLSIDS